MNQRSGPFVKAVCLIGCVLLTSVVSAGDLERLRYHNPGLVVDLGVGLWAWPLPMDFDGDGDNDLLVSCPDTPYNGTYFFENTTGNVAMPVFKAGVRIGPGYNNIRVSFVKGKPRILTPAREFRNFLSKRFTDPVRLLLLPRVHPLLRRTRADQWHYIDYDGDGLRDIVVGIGDWTDYGWDDAYDATGHWTHGPLRGFVYLLRNIGRNSQPRYDKPRKILAAGKPIDVYGRPSPNFADMDGDGDLDLICGEFVDRITYFQNVGTRTVPQYAAGRFLQYDGRPIRMDLEMIVPVAIDWDKDGDIDLVTGDEDGRVALIENSGRIVDAMPQFLPPKYFRQQAAELKFGALVTPYAFDWDGDGDEDILCGDTAGYIGWFENLGGGSHPRWAAPRRLKAAGKTIRIQAGPNGSIQGPCESKWGYTTLTVGDWNHDKRPDILVNSIWGKVVWYENIGTRRKPKLKAAQPIRVAWPGKPPKPAWNWWSPKDHHLVTQWRTTPMIVDFDRDGLNDLVMLDHEGYLAWFRRERIGKKLILRPGRRVFVDENGRPLKLSAGRAGKSGRRKIHIVDWDGDGRLDLLVNSRSVDWLRQVAVRNGKYVYRKMGPLTRRKLAGHSTSPATIDLDGNGKRNLLIGAEDGHLYLMRRSSQ